MEVKCPKCKTKFPVISEGHSKAGKARAKLWTFEQRSEAMKLAWSRKKAKQAQDEKDPRI